MSTKTQRAGYKFLMRTYVYKLETLEDVKPSITKSECLKDEKCRERLNDDWWWRMEGIE